MPVGDRSYEKEEKRKRRKKEKGEKKEKEQGERPARMPAAVLFSRSRVVARPLLLALPICFAPARPPPLVFSPFPPLPLFSLCLLSIFIISSSSPSFFFNSHFSQAFQSVTPRLAAIRLLLLLLHLSLSSHPLSPFILDHWISRRAATPRPNGTNKRGFLSLFPRFSGAEENVTDFEFSGVVTRASAAFLLSLHVYIFRSVISGTRSAPHIIITLHCKLATTLDATDFPPATRLNFFSLLFFLLPRGENFPSSLELELVELIETKGCKRVNF